MVYNKEGFLALVKQLKDTKVKYDKDNIVIIEVKSYEDCNELFGGSSSSWCIAKDEGHWNEYVKGMCTHQYFILDFNNIDTDWKSASNYAMIGFTFQGGELVAAHARNDENLKTGDKFDRLLVRKGIDDFVFKKLNTGMKDAMMIMGIVGIAATLFLYLLFFSPLFKKNETNESATTVVSLPDKSKEIKIGVDENKYTYDLKVDTLNWFMMGSQ